MMRWTLLPLALLAWLVCAIELQSFVDLVKHSHWTQLAKVINKTARMYDEFEVEEFMLGLEPEEEDDDVLGADDEEEEEVPGAEEDEEEL